MKNKNLGIIALAITTALACTGCQKQGEDYRNRIGEYKGFVVHAQYRNGTGRKVRIDWTNQKTNSNEYVFATSENKEYFVNIVKQDVSEGSPLEGLLGEKDLREAYRSASQPVRE